MSRSKFALFQMVGGNLRQMLKVFKRQKMTPALVLAIALSIIAIIFSFLALAPVLSPFIYPLF